MNYPYCMPYTPDKKAEELWQNKSKRRSILYKGFRWFDNDRVIRDVIKW